MQRPHGNCYWVHEHLLAGEYPGAKSPGTARRSLRQHLRAGVNTFVDLTEAGELEPYANLLPDEAAALGVDAYYRRLPIRDFSVPDSPQEMTSILDTLDEAVAGGQTVYLHCWGGVGRTGTVVGCYLVRHGMNGEEALAQLAAWWQTVDKVWRQPTSPETAEQMAYIRTWAERAPS